MSHDTHTTAKVSVEAMQAFFGEAFPGTTLVIEELAPDFARVRQPVDARHLRPGGTVSGPVMMALADAATYAALLATIGLVPLAVTTDLSIHFLRRPAPDRAVVADAKLLKLGRTLAVAEVRLASEGSDALVAHATVTYAIPRADA